MGRWVDSGLTQRSCLLLIVPAGAQWEKAGEVFEAMQAQGCRPDVVTYTALIQAYERGGQWRRALAVSAAFGLSGAWCKQTRLWKAPRAGSECCFWAIGSMMQTN